MKKMKNYWSGLKIMVHVNGHFALKILQDEVVNNVGSDGLII